MWLAFRSFGEQRMYSSTSSTRSACDSFSACRAVTSYSAEASFTAAQSAAFLPLSPLRRVRRQTEISGDSAFVANSARPLALCSGGNLDCRNNRGERTQCTPRGESLPAQLLLRPSLTCFCVYVRCAKYGHCRRRTVFAEPVRLALLFFWVRESIRWLCFQLVAGLSPRSRGAPDVTPAAVLAQTRRHANMFAV